MAAGRDRNRRPPWRVRRLAVLAALTTAAVLISAGVAYPAQQPAQAAAQSVRAAPGPGGNGTHAGAHGDRCHRVSASVTDCLTITHGPTRQLKQSTRPRPGTVLPRRLAAAAALQLPAQCPSRGSFSGQFAPDRFTSCIDLNWTFTATQTSNGVTTTSTFDMEEQSWFSFAPNIPSWNHGLVITAGTGTGIFTGGITLTIQSACDQFPATCSATSNGTPDNQPVTITQQSTFTNSWAEIDQGPALTQANRSDVLDGEIGVVFFWQAPPGFPNQVKGDEAYPHGRCDSIITPTSSPGCVNQAFIPTLTYDSTRNPLVTPVAAHIFSAQHGGLTTPWGTPSHPLTRDMSDSDIAANRNAACGSFVPPDSVNTSCDEYPLASTHQGAAFNPDFSVMGVPISANNSQGGLTGNFYSSNRVLDGDQFLVGVVLPDGTTSGSRIMSVVSGNGEYQLVMQGDGNLVEYFQGRALWASGTAGNPGAFAVMGGGGNLVVYSAGGAVLWQSGTQGNPGATLVLQGDANLVIYDVSGAALWGNGAVNDRLTANQILSNGQTLQSPTRAYQLQMQGDGNLVVIINQCCNLVLWQSGTQGNPGAWASIGTDGNLCVHSSGGTVLWCTGTQGHPGAFAILQNDSNFVIRDTAGTGLWASIPPMPAGEDPVAVSFNGQFQVFARASGSGNLLHTWWDGAWHTENLGGVITGRPSVVVYNGQLQVFADGNDGKTVWHIWYDNRWHPWQSVACCGADPATAVYNNQIQLFARDTGTGHLIHAWCGTACNGTDWQFSDQGGVITGAPSVVSYNGQLQIFADGSDGTTIWHIWYDNSAGWHPWQAIACCGADPATAVYNNQIQLFARDTGTGHLIHAWCGTACNGTDWQFSDQGGVITGAPSVVSYNGQFQIFADGSDGTTVWHIWYDNSVGWHPWQAVAGPGNEPAAALYANQLHLVAHATDTGHVAHAWCAACDGSDWSFNDLGAPGF